MSAEKQDPSTEFGQTEGLFAYRMARSLDGSSLRPDQPISILAEDAVRTALRFKSDEEPIEASCIDIGLATNGLIRALTEDLQVYM